MESPLWSISIICKNEKDTIPKLLDSLEEFIKSGGEIVVVDTGSTDGTIDVLREKGFTPDNSKLRYEEVGERFTILIDETKIEEIYKMFLGKGDKPFATLGKKIFNFSDARNYAASLCSNDWILSVDCDEIFSSMNIKFLNHIIRTGKNDQISFTFRYRNPDLSVRSQTQRDKFYNRKVCKFHWIVHEQAISFTEEKSRMVSVTEGTLGLDHYQHPAEHRSDYLVQMCVDVMNHPENDRHIHWLGREMLYKGLFYSSIKLLKHHIQNPLFESRWCSEKCMSCIFIGESYEKLAKREKNTAEKAKLERKCTSWYFSGIYYDKNLREPWLKLANFFRTKNNHLQAVQCASSALRIKNSPVTYLTDLSCYKSKPYDILYWGFWHLGEKRESFEMWKKAKEISPDNPRFKHDENLFTEFLKK